MQYQEGIQQNNVEQHCIRIGDTLIEQIPGNMSNVIQVICGEMLSIYH